MADKRKEGLKQGLRQLTKEELERVIAYEGEMVLDTYNYQDGKFCPLAIGVGLDKKILEPSHEVVSQTLLDMGYEINNTRGLPGTFYTIERKRDLLAAAREVLEEGQVRLGETPKPYVTRRAHDHHPARTKCLAYRKNGFLYLQFADGHIVEQDGAKTFCPGLESLPLVPLRTLSAIEVLSKQAMEEMNAIEDAAVFADLERCSG